MPSCRHISRAVALEYKYHKPDVFRIVPLPSTHVSRRFNLDPLIPMQAGVLWEYSRRNKIRMSVVVIVLHNRLAVFRDCCGHEFANDAAEVRRHQERFKPLDAL